MSPHKSPKASMLPPAAGARKHRARDTGPSKQSLFLPTPKVCVPKQMQILSFRDHLGRNGNSLSIIPLGSLRRRSLSGYPEFMEIPMAQAIPMGCGERTITFADPIQLRPTPSTARQAYCPAPRVPLVDQIPVHWRPGKVKFHFGWPGLEQTFVNSVLATPRIVLGSPHTVGSMRLLISHAVEQLMNEADCAFDQCPEGRRKQLKECPWQEDQFLRDKNSLMFWRLARGGDGLRLEDFWVTDIDCLPDNRLRPRIVIKRERYAELRRQTSRK